MESKLRDAVNLFISYGVTKDRAKHLANDFISFFNSLVGEGLSSSDVEYAVRDMCDIMSGG